MFNQKGLALILILVGVLLIAAVAGGVYYLGQQSNQNQTVFSPVSQPTPSSAQLLVSPTPDEITNWKTYTNNEYQLELKYPPDWLPSKDTTQSFQEGNDLLFIYKLGVNYHENAPVSDAANLALGIPVKTDQDLNEWVLNYYPKVDPVSNQQNQFSEENISERTFQKVYSCSRDKECTTNYHIKYNGFIYRIAVHNFFVDKEYITYQKLINQILSTFKFLDQNNTPNSQDYTLEYSEGACSKDTECEWAGEGCGGGHGTCTNQPEKYKRAITPCDVNPDFPSNKGYNCGCVTQLGKCGWKK